MLPSLQTLFLPLENGDVPNASPVLFMGAGWHPYLSQCDILDAWQPFRPMAEELEARGIANPAQLPPDKRYNLALVNLPKQAAEAKFFLASALELLNEGGHIIACAANDAGGGRIEGWMKEAGLQISSHSKNKCRAVYASVPARLSPAVKDWYQAGLPREMDIGDGLRFMTQPGLFSWDRIDAGSKILVEHLPQDLKGIGADFGCGIGYLTYHVLKSCAGARAMHCLDADMRALACASTNLEAVKPVESLAFYWKDLSKKVPELPPLDFIVMNPPFHEGKKTDATLGQTFIENASQALKKSGMLFMVSNRHLPYEQILQGRFINVQTVADRDGFKLLKAVK